MVVSVPHGNIVFSNFSQRPGTPSYVVRESSRINTLEITVLQVASDLTARKDEPKEVKEIDSKQNDIVVSGYVSSRYKKPRAGVFTGDKIIYTVEDETGVIIMRVSSKRTELIASVDALVEVGDYIIVTGWWDSETTIYVKTIKMLKKWNG